MNRLLCILIKFSSIRRAYCKFRLYYYVKVRKSVRTSEAASAIRNTVDHNLRALGNFDLNRMDLLIKPLSVIEDVGYDSDILVIGPRNEGDIFRLVSSGFNVNKIRGLDLISYGPYIANGDMHQIPFANCSFDVVLCGWTLSYRVKNELVVSEMLRVLRNGGKAGIGVEFSTASPEVINKLHGYQLVRESGKRINSISDLCDLIGDNLSQIYFAHDAPNRNSYG